MSETASEQRFPVKYHFHKNRYAGTLVDVDGVVLEGETGMKLNVFREELKDMLVSKKIRFWHYLSKEPTYAYFTTSQQQLDRFIEERRDGALIPNTVYHVYLDE